MWALVGIPMGMAVAQEVGSNTVATIPDTSLLIVDDNDVQKSITYADFTAQTLPNAAIRAAMTTATPDQAEKEALAAALGLLVQDESGNVTGSFVLSSVAGATPPALTLGSLDGGVRIGNGSLPTGIAIHPKQAVATIASGDADNSHELLLSLTIPASRRIVGTVMAVEVEYTSSPPSQYELSYAVRLEGDGPGGGTKNVLTPALGDGQSVVLSGMLGIRNTFIDVVQSSGTGILRVSLTDGTTDSYQVNAGPTLFEEPVAGEPLAVDFYVKKVSTLAPASALVTIKAQLLDDL